MEAPNVPESPAMRFRARLRTRWADEDNHGVLNNAVYLTLFEEARHAYVSALGAMRGARFPFLLAQTNVRFLQPGRGAAEVDVEVATTHVGRTSLVQAYRVIDGEVVDGEGAVWCEAEARLVFVEPEAAEPRPQPVPDAVRAAIEALERS